MRDRDFEMMVEMFERSLRLNRTTVTLGDYELRVPEKYTVTHTPTGVMLCSRDRITYEILHDESGYRLLIERPDGSRSDIPFHLGNAHKLPEGFEVRPYGKRHSV